MAPKYPYEYLKPAADEMAGLYRKSIARLQIKLAALMKSLSGAGLTQYSTITAATGYDEAIQALREEVSQIIAQRKFLIREGIERGYVARYSDVLYEAERIVQKKFPDWQREPTEQQLERAFSVRPASVPSFEAIIARNETITRARVANRIQELVTKPEMTAKEFMSGMRDVLTGDYGRSFRVLQAEGARTINTAAVDVFKTTKSTFLDSVRSAGAGIGAVLVWIHDEPITPREWHQDVLHGCLADEQGFWHDEDGDIATMPGGFSNPGNNINCRCTLELMSYDEWQAEFGGNDFPSWMHDPGMELF